MSGVGSSRAFNWHEATNFVMAVDEKADPQLRVLETGWRLVSIADSELMGDVTGPLIAGGPNVILPDTTFGDTKMPLDG